MTKSADWRVGWCGGSTARQVLAEELLGDLSQGDHFLTSPSTLHWLRDEIAYPHPVIDRQPAGTRRTVRRRTSWRGPGSTWRNYWRGASRVLCRTKFESSFARFCRTTHGGMVSSGYPISRMYERTFAARRLSKRHLPFTFRTSQDLPRHADG